MTERPGPPVIREKWRPSLAMVIGAVLVVVLALPLAGMAAVVLSTRPPDVLFTSLAGNLGLVAAAGLVVVTATVLVGYLFWRLVSRPVRELLLWAESVSASPAAPVTRTSGYGTRELARLAASFAAMVRRLDERSDYIATYTAHVSHEMKSPVTSIAGAAEVLKDGGDEMDAETRARFLDNIEQDALRLSALVGRMRELARSEVDRPAGNSDLADILPVVMDRFPELEISRAGRPTSVPLPVEDALPILSHLAENAIAHGATRMAIELASQPRRIVMTVWNDGAPISPGNRARIFEPFFTTRREAGGTGMGLAIVRSLLKTHGATIDLADPDMRSPSDGLGTGFLISFATSR